MVREEVVAVVVSKGEGSLNPSSHLLVEMTDMRRWWIGQQSHGPATWYC